MRFEIFRKIIQIILKHLKNVGYFLRKGSSVDFDCLKVFKKKDARKMQIIKQVFLNIFKKVPNNYNTAIYFNERENNLVKISIAIVF